MPVLGGTPSSLAPSTRLGRAGFGRGMLIPHRLQDPKKLLNHLSLSRPPGTDSPVLCTGQWSVCSSAGRGPWQRACRSLATSTPAWTPGRSNSTSTRRTSKWQSGWDPSEQGTLPVSPHRPCQSLARDKHLLKSACTKARQDTARHSSSTRNSRFKDYSLLDLVYKGSS